MTVCTPHSYAGPQACPYCELAKVQAALERMTRSRDNSEHSRIVAERNLEAERTAHERTRRECVACLARAKDSGDPEA